MNCPRCSAELLDSATFCTQCGTTIRQTGFSYLPAGTPPWPATSPENSSYYAATATMPPPQIVDATAAMGKAKPKRSVGSILLIFVLLVLSIVIGVGGTLGILAASGQFDTPAVTGSRPAGLAPQPVATPADAQTPATTATTPTTPGNQLPTPNSFQIGKVTAIGVSLKYPGDWVEDQPSVGSNGNTAVNFHPQQSLPVSLGVGRLSTSNSAGVSSTDQINQANIQGFGTNQSLKTPQVLTDTPKHRTIGGITWDEQDATFMRNTTGDVVHFVSISVKHNGLYYAIFYFAPTTVYDEAMQKYYSQMLTSFQFTA